MKNRLDESIVIQRLNRGDESALDEIFEAYYGYLFRIAFTILRQTDSAKDCVQDVFVRIWQKRETLEISSSLKGYLQRAVVNECLGALRKDKSFADPDIYLPDSSPNAQQHLESENMAQLLSSAIERLPDQCKLIFRMSRIEEMTYREIAESLGLSPKTVENQIGKALKSLRADLGPWLPLVLPVSLMPLFL
jgi:RNA polymerase sigma-70 factor (family 1)